MFRPSPNELERLKNEEIAKRKLLRLKQVRQYSKLNASKLRNLYKEQKEKVLNKIAQTIQEQFNIEDEQKLLELKQKHSHQMTAQGSGHNNAADWVDPSIASHVKMGQNLVLATERHNLALSELRDEKREQTSTENARLLAMQLALLVEKERAAAVASLPPPVMPLYLQQSAANHEDMTPRVRVCDRSKFSVIESYENRSYDVRRTGPDEQSFNYEAENACVAGELHQNHIVKLSTDLQVQIEEQSIKAQLRGHQAIKKQIVHKDYQELVTDLELVAKGEMAKRQRDYHKNELIGPNSAGYVGAGHNAAMMMFKEKCRERAVEAAVMESLKDITNCTNKNAIESTSDEAVVTNNNNNMSNDIVETESKLSRLYDKIRRQKENAKFQNVPNSKTEIPSNESISSNEENQPKTIRADISRDLDRSDSVMTIYSTDVKSTGNIIQNALTATVRTDTILEKSAWMKERQNFEYNIHAIDKKLEGISENARARPQSPSVKSSQSNRANHVSNLNISHEASSCMDSISVETRESDSLMRIREFQRKALMKLNGQLDISQIYTLEREISNFSFNSSSVTGNLLSDVEHSNIEASESDSSQSIVNEWVNNQLSQTIGKLPDWVTQSNPRFMPDLDISIRNSVFSIKSRKSPLQTDLSGSSSTIGSYNAPIQPSLTEITALRHISNSEQFLNTTDHTEEDSQEQIISMTREIHSSIGLKAKILPQSIHQINCADSNVSDDDLDVESVSYSHEEGVEDLIDLRSVDNERTVTDVTSPIRASNPQLILDHNFEFRQTPHMFLNDNDDKNISENKYSLPISNFIDENQTESSGSAIEYCPQSTVQRPFGNETSDINDNCKTLINEYEQFLNNITSYNDFSKILKDSNVNQTTLDNSDKEYSTIQTNPIVESTDVSVTSSNSVLVESYERLENTTENTTKSMNPVIDCKVFDANSLEACQENHDESTISLINLKETAESSIPTDGQVEQSLTIYFNSYPKTSSTSEQETNISAESRNENEVIFRVPPTILSLSDNNTTLRQIEPYAVLGESIETCSDSDSLKPLSEYHSQVYSSNVSCSDNNSKIPLSSFHSNNETLFGNDEPAEIRNRNILSSTLKPEKMNILPESPDISSICSDASTLLKQRIMNEYFEKNRNILLAAMSNSTTDGLSLKPLESIDDDTPRNIDSGKASSRFSHEQSGESTARMTNDDIFITPRNDSYWTEYTPRDEWSSSHSVLRPLSEYISSNEQYDDRSSTLSDDDPPSKDLDETIKNPKYLENNASIDLINFISTQDLHKTAIFDSVPISDNIDSSNALGSNIEDPITPTSQKLSTVSNPISPPDVNIIDIYSDKSSTECSSSSYKALESFHSSTDLIGHDLTRDEMVEFDAGLYQASDKHRSCSIDSKSEVDISNLSLASFLKNESNCQDITDSNSRSKCDSKPSKSSVTRSSVDNNEEMKNQLDKWKKERLSRVNKNPPNDRKLEHITKDKSMRQKDVDETKSRTLKLWNNLEEVQKMKQLKAAEKLKADNQMRKREYAEKLRKLKLEKQKKNEK